MKKMVTLIALLFPLLALANHPAQGRNLVPLAGADGLTQKDQTAVQLIPASQTNGTEKIAPEVQKAMQSLRTGEMLTVIVTLKDQANLNRPAVPAGPNRAARLKRVIETLVAKANFSQKALKALLAIRQVEKRVGEVTYFWIFNGLAVTATPAIIQELAARPEVLSITANETIQAPPLPEQGQVSLLAAQANLTLINATALWNLGYHGQGIVVANMDTGVDINHPDLGPKWRGGTNSWFDPYGQHPSTPVDLAGGSTGHGTETMGVIVGGEEAGLAFGVAPEAKWIAVKIFKDNGTATTAGFHAGFQWLLDPDGNPATPDAPDVVNNSWTSMGPNVCSLEFQPDLQALRAAGILPIFAAGNFGSGSSTSASPANNPAAFAVGAINNSNTIRNDSSRGPRPASTACGDGTVFPEVVAPGTSIHTTAPTPTNYTNVSGTSLAAPHVAGGLALLLSAAPNLTAIEQETALLNSVVDLGVIGPDNTYGNGRIDLLAAHQSLFDLSVTQSVSASSLVVGSSLTYTLAITNTGPLTATAATLSDMLPSSVAFGSMTFSQGNCTGTSTVSCAFGDLTNGTVVSVTIRVTLTKAGLMTHTVSVAGVKPDLDATNNTTAASTTVIGQVFLPVVLK